MGVGVTRERGKAVTGEEGAPPDSKPTAYFLGDFGEFRGPGLAWIRSFFLQEPDT